MSTTTHVTGFTRQRPRSVQVSAMQWPSWSKLSCLVLNDYTLLVRFLIPALSPSCASVMVNIGEQISSCTVHGDLYRVANHPRLPCLPPLALIIILYPPSSLPSYLDPSSFPPFDHLPPPPPPPPLLSLILPYSFSTGASRTQQMWSTRLQRSALPTSLSSSLSEFSPSASRLVSCSYTIEMGTCGF